MEVRGRTLHFRSATAGPADRLGLLCPGRGALGISSTRELFGRHDSLVHTTSALRYPVFRDGDNYGGTGPTVAAIAPSCAHM